MEHTINILKEIANYKQYSDFKETLVQTDKEIILNHSQQLMNNTFVFDKPWDMERCIIPYTLETLDFNIQKNDDEEWCFMLNRMDYLNYLILSDLITGNTDGGYKVKEIILTWIEQHETMIPECSTRTLDTGIRLMNIFEALPYLYMYKMVDDSELERIILNMKLQMNYLKERYLNRYITSNWGSIQTCALVSIIPLINEDYKNDDLYIWAYNEMIKQFNVQVYDDGMHWEQSTMYHIEVLNYGMKALYYLSFYQVDFDESFSSNVYKLADSLFLQATPRREIETFGDSDRSNIQDVMTRASAIFNNSEFKSLGFDTFDLETLYTFGISSLSTYKNIKSKKSNRNYFDGHDSGMFTLRSSWNDKANFTMFTNGSLGSGHGHCDNLHVSLYHKGQPVFIDSGRLTYREDHHLRTQLKSMMAHNGITIDENEFSKPKDSWSNESFGYPLKNYVNHKDNIHYYEGTIVGQDPLQVFNRKMVVIDKGIWFIVDKVMCDGKHKMTSRFHIEPNKSYVDGKINSLIVDYDDVVFVKNEVCSLRYNEPLNHEVLYMSKEFLNTGFNTYSFYDDSIRCMDIDVYQDNKVIDNEMAFSKKYILSSDESYTVVIFNDEVYEGKKIFFVDGIPFHAKSIVLQQIGEEKRLFKLRT